MGAPRPKAQALFSPWVLYSETLSSAQNCSAPLYPYLLREDISLLQALFPSLLCKFTLLLCYFKPWLQEEQIHWFISLSMHFSKVWMRASTIFCGMSRLHWYIYIYGATGCWWSLYVVTNLKCTMCLSFCFEVFYFRFWLTKKSLISNPFFAVLISYLKCMQTNLEDSSSGLVVHLYYISNSSKSISMSCSKCVFILMAGSLLTKLIMLWSCNMIVPNTYFHILFTVFALHILFHIWPSTGTQVRCWNNN